MRAAKSLLPLAGRAVAWVVSPSLFGDDEHSLLAHRDLVRHPGQPSAHLPQHGPLRVQDAKVAGIVTDTVYGPHFAV